MESAVTVLAFLGLCAFVIVASDRQEKRYRRHIATLRRLGEGAEK